MNDLKMPLVIPYMYTVILIAIAMGLVLCVKAEIYLLQKISVYRSEYANMIAFVQGSNIGRLHILGILAASGALIFLLYGAGCAIADIPFLLSGNIETATGQVVGHDSGGRDDLVDSRGFTIQDIKSGEIIRITTISTPIRLGETYEVVYLPHTHIGAVIQKVE